MHTLSLLTAKSLLLNRKISAEELTNHYLQRIEARKDWNAFITICEERAIKQAKASDVNIREGRARYLEGLPLGIKDLFVTKDILTTAGSKMLYNFIPPYESTITQKLLDAGSIFLGKTNMDEFAMGSSNMTSYFGRVVNPWSKDLELAPGGSSGGSATAVSGHLCLAAIGSDTGGSIRQPAAFCGITGLKPTYGRCSRYGMVPLSCSLDQAGPLTKTVADSAVMLNVMSGYDSNDSTSKNIPSEDFEIYIGKSIKGKKIGVVIEERLFGTSDCMMKALEEAVTMMKEAGAEISYIDVPYCRAALPAYHVITPAEASSNLARYDGVRYGYRSEHADSVIEMYENTRSEAFGDEVKRRILIGTYVLSAKYFDAYYSKAKAVQKVISKDFERIFNEVDLIMLPTTTDSAFPLCDAPTDPVKMYLNDVLTVMANIAGLPAISVPIKLDKYDRPLGIQFISRHFADGELISAGCALEKAANFIPWTE